MSWSCHAQGTKEEVKTKVEQSLDASIETYKGTEEEIDVRAARRAILSALDDMLLEANSLVPQGFHAKIEAYGSRSSGSVSIHVTVMAAPKPAEPPKAA